MEPNKSLDFRDTSNTLNTKNKTDYLYNSSEIKRSSMDFSKFINFNQNHINDNYLKNNFQETFNSQNIIQTKDNSITFNTNNESPYKNELMDKINISPYPKSAVINRQKLSLFANNNNNANNQQNEEKYHRIKNYCSNKNDPDNYPLISYDSFLLINQILTNNYQQNENYLNFLLNKSISIDLFSKFISLLLTRENSFSNKSNIYPKITYQIIFDINNINNFLRSDIVTMANISQIFICILITSDHSYKNIIYINKKIEQCFFFVLDENLKNEKICEIMFNIYGLVFPCADKNSEMNFNITDFSGFKENAKNVLPLIVVEFLSRNKNNFPTDDEDFYYQTILIMAEILEGKLITK